MSEAPEGKTQSLGPYLFGPILHTNDITDDVESIVRLFADDCVCYRVINSKEDCRKLQKDIDTLGAWAEKWGMRFQPIKCNMMTLSRKRSRIEYNYKLKGEDLVFLDSIKYLGATITNNLHWGKHIDEICAKAYRILGMLKRNLAACPQAVKLQAYKGLVRPVLEYTGAIKSTYKTN